MQPTNATTYVDQAVYAILHGDSTLTALGGVYQDTPPEGTNPPYVVWCRTPSAPEQYVMTRRVSNHYRYQVSAISVAEAAFPDDTPAVQMADRVDQLLTDATLNLGSSGLIQMQCRRAASGYHPAKTAAVSGTIVYEIHQIYDVEVTW